MVLSSSCHFRFFKCSIIFQQSFYIFFLFLLSSFRALTANLRTCGINFSSTFLNFFKVVFNYRHLDADCLLSLFIFIFFNRLFLVNLFFCFYISKPDFFLLEKQYFTDLDVVFNVLRNNLQYFLAVNWTNPSK